MDKEDFTILMRRKTKVIHSVSDALIQSKFLIGLTQVDDRVWAEGLLVFYEVFRFLEDCMCRLVNTNIGKFYNDELMRTLYFENDLEMYYGVDWRNELENRTCIQNYINHLKDLEKEDHDLLIAYIYHLYLGLLSGGRILRKKQKRYSNSPKFRGKSSVIDFDDETVVRLKKFIKETTIIVVQNMVDEKKTKILDESVFVFRLNCELIKSIKSADSVIKMYFNRFLILGCIVIGLIYCYHFYNSYHSSNSRGDMEDDL